MPVRDLAPRLTGRRRGGCHGGSQPANRSTGQRGLVIPWHSLASSGPIRLPPRTNRPTCQRASGRPGRPGPAPDAPLSQHRARPFSGPSM